MFSGDQKRKFVTFLIFLFPFFIFNSVLSTKFHRSAKTLNSNKLKFNFSSKHRKSKTASKWHEAAGCFLENLNPGQQMGNFCYEINSEMSCFGAKIFYEHGTLNFGSQNLQISSQNSHFSSENSNSGSHNSNFGPQNSHFSTLNALQVDYSGLPECWPLIREFVCSIQFAPCQNNKARMKLVSKDLCLKTAKKCQFLKHFSNLWPLELDNCSDTTIFTDSCSYLDTKEDPILFWNSTLDQHCIYPLVPSKFENGWILPRCALNCTSHWLTESEHDYLRSIIAYCGVPVFIFTCFIWISFLIRTKNCTSRPKNGQNCQKIEQICPKMLNFDQKSMDFAIVNRQIPIYFSKPLTWYLFSHCLILLCWLIHLSPAIKNTLNCRNDGSLRKFEIGPQQNLLCGVQFLAIYFGIIGASVWLVIFAYYLRLSYTMSRDRIEQGFKNKVAWLHLTWGTPIILAIYPIAAEKVESDGISGICFVGYSEPIFTLLFVYLPVTLMFLAAMILFCSGLIDRRRLYREISPNLNQIEYFSTLKLTLFFTIHAIALSISWIMQIFTQNLTHFRKNQAFSAFLQCQMQKNYQNLPNFQAENECELEYRPDIRLIVLQILTFFISTLITDICLFVGGDLCKIWQNLIGRFFLLCFKPVKHWLFKSGTQNLHRNGPPTENFDPQEGQHEEEKSINANNGNEYEMSSLDSSNNRSSRSDLEMGHESQKSFRKRLRYRAKNYRNNNSKLLKNSATPSSLLSSSFSSMLNCSSAELPFSHDSTPGAKNFPPNFLAPPFPYYPMAPNWYPFNSTPMFYPHPYMNLMNSAMGMAQATQASRAPHGQDLNTSENTPSENNAENAQEKLGAEFPGSTSAPKSAAQFSQSQTVSSPFLPNFYPPSPFYFPFPAPFWAPPVPPYGVPPIFGNPKTGSVVADSNSNENEEPKIQNDENKLKAPSSANNDSHSQKPIENLVEKSHVIQINDDQEDIEEYKNSASDTCKCDSDSDESSCDSEEAALIERQFEICFGNNDSVKVL